MSLFPHKYIVTFHHYEHEFDSGKTKQVTVKAFDEKEAIEIVRDLIHDKYPFYTIVEAKRK